MALLRWIQMGVLLGSVLFGWLLGSRNEETRAPEPTVPKMEITVRLQDGESESLWTGYIVLADSTAPDAPSSLEITLDAEPSPVWNLGTDTYFGGPSHRATAGRHSCRNGCLSPSSRCEREAGTGLDDRTQMESIDWVTSLQSVNRKIERLADVWGKDWAWVGHLRGKQ